MRTVTTVADLREQIALWRAKDDTIALVPTMGALHDGHVSLVETARTQADRTIVSIFLNPRQFAPNEDLSTYPRDLEADAAMLAASHVDLLYAPSHDEVFPNGFATMVNVEGPASGLEASSRPHFFAGVATIVTKLFTQSEPDVAVFGEKDYQQLLVVKRLVCDLNLRPHIVSAPTVREPDGLALSSRNAYLDDKQRRIAPHLYETLAGIAARLPTHDEPDKLLSNVNVQLGEVFDRVDYFDWRDAETLELRIEPERPSRLLGAVRLGHTRLIDNVPVAPTQWKP